MFGVDISGNQPGDILSKISFDFAIVKATGNPNTNGYAWNYVNPKMKQQADEALAKTGCLGLYCFAWGKDAIQEADFFVDTIKDYIGKAIPFLDYEAPFSNQNRREWCRTFVRRVKERTGSTVGIYASSSVINAQNLVGLAQEENCLLWSANYYLGYKVISGYSTSGMKMAIPGSDLWQFTSSGRLNGYSGNLDLNECNFSAEQWRSYASGKSDSPAQPDSSPVNDAGLWYRAHVQNLGWLDPVHDGMIAGTEGESLRLESLQINPPEGVELNVKLHIAFKGWVTYEGIKHGDSLENQLVIGTVGESLQAEAIEFDVVKNDTGKELRYQVHIADYGTMNPIDAPYTAGTVGISKAIESIRIELV